MTTGRFFLECEAGVAGDMLVGAMLDLGADENKLISVLKSLPLEGYFVTINRVKKAGIDACDFDVVLDEEHDNHDHDMEYLHGSHGDEIGHHHHHHHGHRHLGEIFDIIDAGTMSDEARILAKRIFRVLGEAEALAHGTTIDEVHFHEVGAVDSIVDIVAIAVCADDLGIESLIVPYLCEGQGTIRCAHGIMPIPVPAVANIIKAYGIALKRIGVDGEFVTPTGAAAVAAFRKEEKLPDTYRVIRSGTGAGKREYERASIVRLYEIEAADTQGDEIWRLETDIDDSTGERLGYVMSCLYENGALEVHYTPTFMKKNRPGVELVVICDDGHREKLEELIFTETTTIGIRRMKLKRSKLKRTGETWETPRGKVDVKIITLPDGSRRYEPEYDSVVELSKRTGSTYSESLNWIKAYIQSNMAGGLI